MRLLSTPAFFAEGRAKYRTLILVYFWNCCLVSEEGEDDV